MNISVYSGVLFYTGKIFLYLFVVASLYFAFGSDILYLFKQMYKKKIFRTEKREHSKLYNHIDKIYFSLKGSSESSRVFNFYAVTVALFVVPLFVMLKISVPLFALFLSVFLALVPYAILRLRLYRIRVESSYDADKVVTEITNQYKICGFNMREAIRKAEKYLSSAPFCQKHIYALALGLDTYKTEEELKKYLDYFVFGVNTQWAKMLANNIYFAVVKEFNVVEGLSDILKDIKNSFMIAESSKRENAESVLMVVYMAPALFLLSPVLSHWMMDLSFSTFLRYQFRTPIGITLFTLILIGFVFCVFMISFINKKKFDI